MKKILLSTMTIAIVGAVAVGATSAVFTSQATVDNNTFATGILEVRVNGQPTIAGFNFVDAAPGDCTTFQHNVNNYGQPWFAGPSTLDAKTLTVSSSYDSGSGYLYNKLDVTVGADRGWGSWMPVYSGPLNGLSGADLLSPRWTELIPGSSEDVQYTVCLPTDANDSYQGLSTTFDFVIDATNP